MHQCFRQILFTPLGDITERPAGAPNNAVLIDGPLRDLLALGPLRLVAVDGPIDGSSAASACVEGLPGADRDVALNHAERIESAEGIETVRLGAGPCPQVSPR